MTASRIEPAARDGRRRSRARDTHPARGGHPGSSARHGVPRRRVPVGAVGTFPAFARSALTIAPVRATAPTRPLRVAAGTGVLVVLAVVAVVLVGLGAMGWGAMGLGAVGIPGPVSAGVIAAALLVVPGAAVWSTAVGSTAVGNSPEGPDRWARAGLVVVTSVAIEAALTAAMIWTGAWFPRGCGVLVLLGSAVALTLRVSPWVGGTRTRRGRRGVAADAPAGSLTSDGPVPAPRRARVARTLASPRPRRRRTLPSVLGFALAAGLWIAGLWGTSEDALGVWGLLAAFPWT